MSFPLLIFLCEFSGHERCQINSPRDFPSFFQRTYRVSAVRVQCLLSCPSNVLQPKERYIKILQAVSLLVLLTLPRKEAAQCYAAFRTEIIDFLLSAPSSFTTNLWLFLTQFCQVCCSLWENVLQGLAKSAVHWWLCRPEFKKAFKNGPTEDNGLLGLI